MRVWDTADSVEEWIRLAKRYRRSAELLVQDPLAAEVAWSNAGFACECILKAAIMANERLNSWPSIKDRRELYVHDLEKLAAILQLQIGPFHSVAPAWSVLVKWRRDHMYAPGQLPLPVIKSLLDAAFSERGLEPWIFQSYLKSYV